MFQRLICFYCIKKFFYGKIKHVIINFRGMVLLKTMIFLKLCCVLAFMLVIAIATTIYMDFTSIIEETNFSGTFI